MQLTAEKAAYIEEKLKQFKLVDMRQQYSDIIREAESSSMDYLEFFMRLINAEDEGKNNRRTEKLLANAGFDLPSRLDAELESEVPVCKSESLLRIFLARVNSGYAIRREKIGSYNSKLEVTIPKWKLQNQID